MVDTIYLTLMRKSTEFIFYSFQLLFNLLLEGVEKFFINPVCEKVKASPHGTTVKILKSNRRLGFHSQVLCRTLSHQTGLNRTGMLFNFPNLYISVRNFITMILKKDVSFCSLAKTFEVFKLAV